MKSVKSPELSAPQVISEPRALKNSHHVAKSMWYHLDRQSIVGSNDERAVTTDTMVCNAEDTYPDIAEALDFVFTINPIKLGSSAEASLLAWTGGGSVA